MFKAPVGAFFIASNKFMSNNLTMEKIIVVDDDYTQIEVVKNILTKSGYEVIGYSDPKTLVMEYFPGKADLILSDINMPGLSGIELYDIIRGSDKNVPFILFTATSDIDSVIDYFKRGVSDYLTKPIHPGDLIHRVQSVLLNIRHEKNLKKVQIEKELVELENNKLINWKKLYGHKDIQQTKQMMSFFSRSINAGGGYLWLDILSKLKPEESGDYLLDKDLYSLILESANAQRKSFNFISFVNNLPKIEGIKVSLNEFLLKLGEHCTNVLEPLYKDSNRELSLNFNNLGNSGSIFVDFKILFEVLLELCINSIKFSPNNSKIIIEVYRESGKAYNTSSLIFNIRNIPKESTNLENEETSVIGIPYDYSEAVFDLFYTMESYPSTHPKEVWGSGTGLYICRNLINGMKGYIECGNMADYSRSMALTYVQFKLSLPIMV